MPRDDRRGYRGEILVNLVNLDPAEPFEVRRGDRIAQLVVQRVAAASFVEVDSLSESSRGKLGTERAAASGRARPERHTQRPPVVDDK